MRRARNDAPEDLKGAMEDHLPSTETPRVEQTKGEPRLSSSKWTQRARPVAQGASKSDTQRQMGDLKAFLAHRSPTPLLPEGAVKKGPLKRASQRTPERVNLAAQRIAQSTSVLV